MALTKITNDGVAGISSSSTSGTALSIDANNLVFPKIPAFEAIKSSSQTLSSNVATKITFNTESYDTAGFYDLTNSKFQPTIAGYYHINLCLYFGSGNNQITLSHLYKNGSEHRKIAHLYHTDSSLDDYGVSGSTLVYLNGSTDYIEAYGTAIGSNRIVNGDGDGRETVISGFLVSI